MNSSVATIQDKPIITGGIYICSRCVRLCCWLMGLHLLCLFIYKGQLQQGYPSVRNTGCLFDCTTVFTIFARSSCCSRRSWTVSYVFPFAIVQSIVIVGRYQHTDYPYFLSRRCHSWKKQLLGTTGTRSLTCRQNVLLISISSCINRQQAIDTITGHTTKYFKDISSADKSSTRVFVLRLWAVCRLLHKSLCL